MGGFPGCPVVKTLHFHCRGMSLTPGQGTKILHATQPKKKKRKKENKWGKWCFPQMVPSDWLSTSRGMKLDSYSIPHTKSISKHTEALKVKSKISLSPLYPRVPCQWIQLMPEQKIFFKKIKNFQKEKVKFTTCQQLFT